MTWLGVSHPDWSLFQSIRSNPGWSVLLLGDMYQHVRNRLEPQRYILMKTPITVCLAYLSPPDLFFVPKVPWKFLA